MNGVRKLTSILLAVIFFGFWLSNSTRPVVASTVTFKSGIDQPHKEPLSQLARKEKFTAAQAAGRAIAGAVSGGIGSAAVAAVIGTPTALGVGIIGAAAGAVAGTTGYALGVAFCFFGVSPNVTGMERYPEDSLN